MPLLTWTAALMLSAAIALAQDAGHADIVEPYVPPPADNSTLQDPVTLLARRLEAGQAKLTYDIDFGYLSAILRELKIPVSSQMLVFSKTSLQHEDISPRTPRAIYFNDDVYVGYVPDGNVIELSAVEPTRGAVFYTVTQARGSTPRLVTNAECVQCHQTPVTLNVPGHLMRSVFVSGDGRLAPRVRSFLTDHTSPISERWGGWYVSGTPGSTHMGNAYLPVGQDETTFDRARGTAITSVGSRIHGSRYPAGESDVVALMVLGHQVRMHNLIAQLHQKAARGLPVASAIDELLRYTLFVDEAPLQGPVKGVSSFAVDFERLGPKDTKGRSLRQFDLQRRLFRYPCSYLIYSGAFRALPDPIRQQVYTRLADILSGRDTSPAFAKLTPADRTSIAEILAATDRTFAAVMR